MTSNPDTVLLTRLRSQLEFYFSPQNLARDVYLRNLLNSYGFNAVPLSIIANFPKVRSLCNGQIDFALLKRSVEGSGIVSVTNDAVWISPLLPLPPLDTKPQQRATLGPTQPQPQVQQTGVSTKAAEAGDGSRTHSANSSQNSLIAMSNGYVNDNGAYTPNTTNAAPPLPVAARASDSSRPNQSQHPGHNSLSDTPQAQLPSQPAQLNTAAPPPPHQQPHPAHANAIPYPAAPIAHPSHGATTYAYPQYAYRYPPGPAYHHHPPGGYSAYPSHMVPYPIYGYPPYVQNDGARGYFTGGRGGGGPVGARSNGEGENGGMRRGSTGKGGADGSKKGKGKAKKTSGMQHYQNHHGADSGGNANNYYGGSAQQQQPQRWKGERSDGGNSSGNDTYGKPTGKNHHHQSRAAGKYDNTNWDRMNRGNNRSQNDIIPQTDAEGRIGSGDAYYGESNNPLVRGGEGTLNAKPSGGRKKKNKRREGDSERRKDSNLVQTADNPKREIFDANSFPALPLTKIEIAGGSSGANQTKSLPSNDNGCTKTVDPSSVSMHPISGYADALKQTTKSSKPQMTEQQSSVSAPSGGPSHNDNVGPQNATTSATVVTPPPSEMTTTTNATKIVEDILADMKITPSSTDGTPQPQEPQTVFESETTIAVGVLTGIPMTTTEVEPKSTVMSLESTISLSPQSSVSPTDAASNAQQSNKHEPTPREATHTVPKPPEEDMTPVITDGSAGIAQAEERGVVSPASSSSPPSVWGSKRSWIDVARKQS